MENAFTVCNKCQELQIKTLLNVKEIQRDYQKGLITLNECMDQIKNVTDVTCRWVSKWLAEEKLDTIHLEMYSRIPK